MSGYVRPKSRIEIAESQIRRLNKENQKLQATNRSFQNSLRQAVSNSDRKLRKVEESFKKREKSFQKTVGNLRSDLKTVEKKHRAAIIEQNRKFNAAQQKQKKEFDKKLGVLEENVFKELANERKLTDSKLETLRKEHQGEINNLKDAFNSIMLEKGAREDFANDLIHDLEILAKEIEEEYPYHKKFSPGSLGKINREIQDAASLIKSAPQAAIGNSRTAYFKITDLREEVENKKNEYETWRINTLELFTALHDVVNENREIELDGVKQEADYWTNGKYSDFEDRIESRKRTLDLNADVLTLEKIKEFNSELDVLKKEHEELIREALTGIVNSQIRYEVGESIIDTLEKQGFKLEEEGYEKEDFSKAYLLKMKDTHTNTKIAAIVNPEGDNKGFQVVLNSSDATFSNPRMAQHRIEEIKEAIKKEKGIDLGPTECVDDRHTSVASLYGDGFANAFKNGIPKRLREQLKLSDPDQRSSEAE